MEARTNSRRSRQLSSDREASAPGVSTGMGGQENLEKKLGSNAAISQTDPVTSGEPPS